MENPTRHFIISEVGPPAQVHCVNWLVRASSLREALTKYYLERHTDAELLSDGSIRIGGCGSETIVYSHILECIEAHEKANELQNGMEWKIKELYDEHWDADLAEVSGSSDPYCQREYVDECRPLFRQKHPRSTSRAFVWYLKDGPLVTFYRRKNKRCRWPIEILGRYQIVWRLRQTIARPPWSDEFEEMMVWEDPPKEIREWTGTYDDLLEQMKIHTPVPGEIRLPFLPMDSPVTVEEWTETS